MKLKFIKLFISAALWFEKHQNNYILKKKLLKMFISSNRK